MDSNQAVEERGYGCCFGRKPKSAFESRVVKVYVCGCSDRSTISSLTDHRVCFHSRLRLSGGSFGLLPSSSESKLRSVSKDPLPALNPPQKLRRFFLKRSTRFLHYLNEWKRPRHCDRISPQNPDLEGPWQPGGRLGYLQIAGTGRGTGSGDLRVFRNSNSLSLLFPSCLVLFSMHPSIPQDLFLVR